MRELNTIHERRLRQRCSATSIIQKMVFRGWKCSAAQTWRGFGSVVERNRCSPVKKSADDANGHQQLQHQGQVDFPDEPCRLKRERRCSKSVSPWSEPRCFCSLLTSPDGPVVEDAEGAVVEVLRVFGWSVAVLLISLAPVGAGGRRGDNGDVPRPDLIHQHQRSCETRSLFFFQKKKKKSLKMAQKLT